MLLKLSIALFLTNAFVVLSKSESLSRIELRAADPPLEKSRNEICKAGLVDATTMTKDGTTYFFKGNYYWKIDDALRILVDFRVISDDWQGVKGPIDAALTWDDGSTFLFKGDKYWKFVNQVSLPGYPRKIEDGFKGIPNDIDAALVWSKNLLTYFFKGDRYWWYDPKATVPTGKPQPINAWKGVPNNIDAALRWEGGNTYFFKGSNYYKYDNKAENVSYSLSNTYGWFHCGEETPKPERYLPIEPPKTSEDIFNAIVDLKKTIEILFNKIMTKRSNTMKTIAQFILDNEEDEI